MGESERGFGLEFIRQSKLKNKKTFKKTKKTKIIEYYGFIIFCILIICSSSSQVQPEPNYRGQ